MAGGSGEKKMVINTLERSVSTDYNRGWAFNAAQSADALSFLLNNGLGTNLGRGSALAQYVSSLGPVAAPTGATVLGGAMVTASVGSNELGVTPGAIIFIDPDGLTGSTEATPQSADDAVPKLVVDRAGILSGSGSLVFVTNGSGSIRVDVVECRRKPDTLESASRDIYDPNTGLFTPALVTKVNGAQAFEYRLRTGTVGNGVPANVQGWLPLCVIGVPSAAVNFDTCTMYDVRPLASDRQVLTEASDESPHRWGQVDADMSTNSTVESRVFGSVNTYVGGYRAGGKLSSVVGGVDVDYVDIGWAQVTQQTHDSTSLTRDGVTEGWRSCWLMFPNDLPRWVRYSIANVAPFGARVPQGPRGVLVLSDTISKTGIGHVADAAIAMPPSSGLDATTTAIVGFLAFPFASNGAVMFPMISPDGRKFVSMGFVGAMGWDNQIPGPTITANLTEWTTPPFGHAVGAMPRNAKRVLLEARVGFITVAATVLTVRPELAIARGDDPSIPGVPLANQSVEEQQDIFITDASGAGLFLRTRSWCSTPLQRTGFTQPAEYWVGMNWVASGGAVTLTTPTMRIMGFEF